MEASFGGGEKTCGACGTVLPLAATHSCPGKRPEQDVSPSPSRLLRASNHTLTLDQARAYAMAMRRDGQPYKVPAIKLGGAGGGRGGSKGVESGSHASSSPPSFSSLSVPPVAPSVPSSPSEPSEAPCVVPVSTSKVSNGSHTSGVQGEVGR
jgi:hypothetical protein